MVHEDALIDEALAGNAAAFGELVCAYQDRLFHAMRHVLCSAEDAEDVVQDAFVQAFVKLESFRRAAGFYTWLYRIAFNRAQSLVRRRRGVPLDGLAEQQESADGAAPPDGRLRQQENADQVHAVLEAMPEEHRAVLVLREMEGCPYETISEILDLPIGTVRSRLHRARLDFKHTMKRLFAEEMLPS